MTGTIGRSFDELADLIDRGRRRRPRIGACLDCCHLLASGFDIRTAAGLERGRGRLRPRARARPRALPARERLEGPARRRTATATPTSRTASSGARGWARSCPSRASRACRRCSRWPGRTAADPTRIRSGSPASSAPRASRRGRRERHALRRLPVAVSLSSQLPSRSCSGGALYRCCCSSAPQRSSGRRLEPLSGGQRADRVRDEHQRRDRQRHPQGHEGARRCVRG